MGEIEISEKTLEKTLQKLSKKLKPEDTFTITFKNGVILTLQVIQVDTTN